MYSTVIRLRAAEPENTTEFSIDKEMEKGKDSRGVPNLSKLLEVKVSRALAGVGNFPRRRVYWYDVDAADREAPPQRRETRSIPWLEVLDSDFGKMHGYTPDVATSSDAISPRAFKSHLPYEHGLPHTTAAKYIYVMRNPDLPSPPHDEGGGAFIPIFFGKYHVRQLV